MLRGSCLCGAIRFEITGPVSGIGICHCSLCRKGTGAGSSAVITTAIENLVFIAGRDQVATYQRPSGYGNSFCKTCGSPAPDTDAARTLWAIPAGALDDDPALAVRDHIFVGSKAGWDRIGDDGAPQFATWDEP